MAEIEITLPTIQYGKVKVRATPEELGVDVSSPASVGTAMAVYFNLFTQGFKVGASLDVTASPTEGLSASQEAPEGKAQAILDEGLGGVTEVEENDNIPWNREVARQPKPWETRPAAPKAAVSEDW